jgi:hypothetical protein
MPGKNMWGDLANLGVKRTPRMILREQADFLTKATSGVLVGRVTDQSGAEMPDSIARIFHGPARFAYALDIVVPTLNHYTYTLLTIEHGMKMYPVRVQPAYEGTPVVARTEALYEHHLGALLSSTRVKSVLTTLLSQAKGAE